MAELTDEHRAMLDFERHQWRYLGVKDAEVRKRFDLDLPSYQQRLNAILEEPAALAHAPATVRRLRRLRQRRLAARRAGRASAGDR
jgi:hypothetical protein